MKRTIGGDRLGSGKKMVAHLHGYGRSSYNLSKLWMSSQSFGTLVPCHVEFGGKGDTFDIDITTKTRTLPTNGAIFGRCKQQIDVFVIPLRLYNAQLHNNALNIGMKMEKIKFPLINLKAPNIDFKKETALQQINPSSLINYLGIRALGYSRTVGVKDVRREFNAIPMLAYYDIYKNYYANKQETNAQVVSNGSKRLGFEHMVIYSTPPVFYSPFNELLTTSYDIKIGTPITFTKSDTKDPANVFEIITKEGSPTVQIGYKLLNGYLKFLKRTEDADGRFRVEYETINPFSIPSRTEATAAGFPNATLSKRVSIDAYEIKAFPLENIDRMREEILSASKTNPFEINGTNAFEPYLTAVGNKTDGTMNAASPMNGLALKTYQSDRFNNWISKEWIDGANGIAAVTAVDVSSGKLNLDALNLAEKVYNMLNRIAVSGGSYYDWLEVNYGGKTFKLAETPVYVGGMSTEIDFDEVVSTADATLADGTDQPLGSLAGRGSQKGAKGGNSIRVKCIEPSLIMAITSITPEVIYSQGNWWFNRLKTMNDLHKPALDGIGYQDLITDEIAAWSTDITNSPSIDYKSVGKQPAYMEYRTNISEAYGTFAEENKEMFMTFNRRYTHKENGDIEDMTTYIDPSKFNYAFANAALDAQNFWVQIGFKVLGRRVMSAKLIPNL